MSTLADVTYLEPPPPEDDYQGGGPTPPQAPDAERAVLGALLQDPTIVAETLAEVSSRDFYNHRHEVIFDAIKKRAEELEPIDALVIGDDLERAGQLKRVGGIAYLHELVQSVGFVTSNAPYHAGIIAERAGLRRLIEAGTRIVHMGYGEGEGDLAEIMEKAQEEIAKARSLAPTGEEVVHSWSPIDLGQIVRYGDTVQIPEVLHRTDGFCLLYRGSFHSLAGEPSSGKSWVALIACAQELAEGEHVTYVDWEDRPGRIVGRLLLLGANGQHILDRFHYIRPQKPLDRLGREYLDQEAARSSLVILDGVTEAMTLHGLSIDAQDDAAKFIHMFPRHLADLGPAVLQIDHVVKNADQQGRFAIGAQHKLAGLDGAAYMIKVLEPFGRGKKGRAKITVSKDREGAVDEKAVGRTICELVLDSTHDVMLASLEVPHASSRATDGTFRPTILMERVSRFIEANPGSSSNQIDAGVPGKAQGKREALRILNLEGFVTTEQGPRRSVLYTSTAVYREATDPLAGAEDPPPPEGF
jgi:hypothetical protein